MGDPCHSTSPSHSTHDKSQGTSLRENSSKIKTAWEKGARLENWRPCHLLAPLLPQILKDLILLCSLFFLIVVKYVVDVFQPLSYV